MSNAKHTPPAGELEGKMARCDMCHKELRSDTRRYRITTILRPNEALTVGPECYRKEKKARKEVLARHTPEEIEALRAKFAAIAKAEAAQ